MGRYPVIVSVALAALLAAGCSDDHSTPITPAAAKTALSQMVQYLRLRDSSAAPIHAPTVTSVSIPPR